MRAINTLIIWTDESRKAKIADDISLLCRCNIIDAGYDQHIDLENKDIHIVVVDIDKCDDKKIRQIVLDTVKEIKEQKPEAIFMMSGKCSADIKKKFKNQIDIFSGITAIKIKNDYRSCLDMLICSKHKLNFYLTDFFAPHLVGDLSRKGFELVLNDTYERDTYKEDFLDLWRSFMFVAPLLKPDNRDILKAALHAYEERELTYEEKNEIRSEFFFQFNTLPVLHNFTDRRLYYIEKSVIADVWESVIQYARDIDNSLLFGCHKLRDRVHLKIMIHKGYSLNKITKNSKIHKKMSEIIPYGDILIKCGEQRMFIGSDPIEGSIEEPVNQGEEEQNYLTFHIYVKTILPHRRHRGLKRF